MSVWRPTRLTSQQRIWGTYVFAARVLYRLTSAIVRVSSVVFCSYCVIPQAINDKRLNTCLLLQTYRYSARKDLHLVINKFSGVFRMIPYRLNHNAKDSSTWLDAIWFSKSKDFRSNPCPRRPSLLIWTACKFIGEFQNCNTSTSHASMYSTLIILSSSSVSLERNWRIWSSCYLLCCSRRTTALLGQHKLNPHNPLVWCVSHGDQVGHPQD